MKKKVTIGVLFALLTIGAFGVANAALITIDPDDFPPGTDLTNAFAAVVLNSIGPGFDGDNDPRIFGIDPLAHPEPFNASTGGLVFGTNDNRFPSLFGGFGGAQLRVDFAAATGEVRLDAIGNNSSDFARFQAFNSLDMLLDSYSTAQLIVSQFETMIVTSAGGDIAYVVASGVGGDSVGFDHLQYDAAPEPGILALFSLGLTLVGAHRRRRKMTP